MSVNKAQAAVAAAQAAVAAAQAAVAAAQAAVAAAQAPEPEPDIPMRLQWTEWGYIYVPRTEFGSDA